MSRASQLSSVADDYNWSVRVLNELDAAKRWEADWGHIYGEGASKGGEKSPDRKLPSRKERIDALEKELKTLTEQAQAKMEAARGRGAAAVAGSGTSLISTTMRDSYCGRESHEIFGVAQSGKRKLHDGIMPSCGPGVDW